MSELKERVLEDSYPIYGDYYYVVDGRVYRSDFHGITARELRLRLRAGEIRNCDIFGRGGFEACARATSAHADADSPTAWPAGCHDPNSCERHKECMYTGCSHAGKRIETTRVPSEER